MTTALHTDGTHQTQALGLDDVWNPLPTHPKPLIATAPVVGIAAELAARFDYAATGHEAFTPWRRPADLPRGLGVIVGGSGTGKTTLLGEFGHPQTPQWNPDRPIAAHFTSADDAAARLYAVGLSSVPTWMRPYSALSNGEQFRANLARNLKPGAVIDEYTSVVDRVVAVSTSKSLGKFVRSNALDGVVLATVHRDVLPWLQPAWVIDTDAGAYATRPRECLQRPPLVAQIHQVDRTLWGHFMGHHYLSGDLHPFARCYVAALSGAAVSFVATIPFPHGAIANAWRETRLVTLPDYQGLGVGPRLSDWVAAAHVRAGYRFYSKTVHPRLGEWRDRSPHWRPTGSNHKRSGTAVSFGRWNAASGRLSYSHEFTG